MKILIVEDNKARIKWFKESLIGHSIDVVESADPAKILVKEKKYDFIFLDHDLGERENVDSSDENTGFQVAKVMKDSINSQTKTVVHSCSKPGADNIISCLGHGEIIPFILLRNRQVEEILNG